MADYSSLGLGLGLNGGWLPGISATGGLVGMGGGGSSGDSARVRQLEQEKAQWATERLHVRW